MMEKKEQGPELIQFLNSQKELISFRQDELIEKVQLQFFDNNNVIIHSKNPSKNLVLKILTPHLSSFLSNIDEFSRMERHIFQNQKNQVLFTHFPTNKCEPSFFIKQIFYGRQFDEKSFQQLSPADRIQIQQEILGFLSRIHSFILSVPKKYFIYKDFLEYLRVNYKNSETRIQTNIEDLLYWFQLLSFDFSVEESLCLGDVSLSNFIFDPHEFKIIDIANWQGIMYGNPYLELGLFLSNYEIPYQKNLTDYGLQNIQQLLGIKSKKELIQEYFKLKEISSTIKNSTTEISNQVIHIEYNTILALLSRSVKKQQQIKTETNQQNKLNHQLQLEAISKAGWNKVLEISNGDPFNLKSKLEIDKILWSNYPVSQRCQSYYYRIRDFMRDEVFPIEKSQFDIVYEYNENNHWKGLPGIEELQRKAKSLGLWNLFISDPIYGKGLNNLEYAFLSELMGTSFFGHEIFNCYAPETGNIKLLIMAGTEFQKQKYLIPLLEGECKTFFAMSEKNVASSDPTNFETLITKQGDGYVIKGSKWMVSGIKDERCRFGIIMGKTKIDPKSPFTEQTMFLVDLPNPNITMKKSLSVLGYDEAPHGLFEVEFNNVYVPKENMLGQEGNAFAMSQGRLLGGRLHHSVRLLGLARRSIDVVLQKAQIKNTQDEMFKYDTSFQDRIGRIECDYQICKIMILNAAMILDTLGSRHMSSLKAVSETKAFVPNQSQCIIDECISLFGVSGMTNDYILMIGLKACRGLRMMDGPCELHKKQVARFTQGSHLFNEFLNSKGYLYANL